MHTCMHACTHMHTHVHTCMRACAHMHIHTHAHTHTHTHTHTHVRNTALFVFTCIFFLVLYLKLLGLWSAFWSKCWPILNEEGVFQMFSSEIVSHYGISPLAEDEEEEEEVTKKKSLGVGMSCVVDLCNWQRVSMDSTRASRCLSGLQRVSGLLIGVWTIYTSYLYICMSLCPRMTAPAEREKLRRSAWLGAECPHVGWSDCCLSSYVRHPSGPGVCCVKHTPGAQFGVI